MAFRHQPVLNAYLRSSSRDYLSSTEAPASSSCFFKMSSASSLETPSLRVAGAPSTRPLASFRPRPVIPRTTLITLTFLSPAPVRTTSNSSSLQQLPPASPPAAAGSNSNSCCSRNAELLFHRFDQLNNFHYAHFCNGIQNIVFRQMPFFNSPFNNQQLGY